MTERPILFSGPMVNAILAGTKTETRRLASNRNCARIEAGDILWVREAWAPADHMVFHGPREDPVAIAYRADRQVLVHECVPPWKAETAFWNWALFKWRPSIFMPKFACRIRLRVLSVRVESLHDLGYRAVLDEGLATVGDFMEGWDKLNNKPGCRWTDNPEVRVIAFARLEPGDDA